MTGKTEGEAAFNVGSLDYAFLHCVILPLCSLLRALSVLRAIYETPTVAAAANDETLPGTPFNSLNSLAGQNYLLFTLGILASAVNKEKNNGMIIRKKDL